MENFFKKNWAVMTAMLCALALSTLQFLLPISGIIFAPLAVIALLYIAFKTRFYVPMIFLFVYMPLNIFFNWDAILIILFPSEILLYLSCYFLLKNKNLYVAFSAVMALALAGAAIPFSITSVAVGKSPDSLIKQYIVNGENNVVLTFLAEKYYEKTVFDDPYIKLEKTDANYTAETLSCYGESARRDCAEFLLYYLALYAGVTACVTLLCGIFIIRRQRLPLPLSDGVEFKGMRLPKSFLTIVFAPLFVLGIVALCVPVFMPLYSALFCFCVTVPCAANGFTLLLHCGGLFKNKWKTVATVVVFLIAAACLIFEIGLFLLSLIGFADIILNVRKLLDYALS